MKKPFYSLGLGTLALMIFWSCTLEGIDSPRQAVLVDPLPVARSYYDLEKPKQGNLYGRIQSDLEVFPYWEGAKSYSDGKILIVPAHRKVKATYAQGYLRRLVFELNAGGEVIRGGILEMAGKDGDFLLENEGVLIEGFLSGLKSSQLTYLWSDFGSNPVDGIQANGQLVERSLDRLLNSRRGLENFSTENCTDWYWVYSIGGVVIYEEYSHTTCGSGSCDANSQDACLDDGTNGGGSDYVYIDNPCDIMKVLSENFGFKSKFQEMSNNTSLNFETGYLFSKNGVSYNFTYIQGLANDPEINFSISGPIDGFIHSHYTGTYSLFSGTDIKTMYEIYQLGMMNNPLSFTIGVASPQGNSYTVGIEDVSLFLSFSASNFSNQSSFNSLENFYQNNFTMYSLLGKSEVEARELAFLETFANSGLQLFKGNSDFSAFNRIIKNNNQVVSQNCH
jgi:hypothetical protein